MNIVYIKYKENRSKEYQSTGAVAVLNEGFTRQDLESLVKELVEKIRLAVAPDPVYVGEVMTWLRSEIRKRKIGTIHSLNVTYIEGVGPP